MIKRRILSSSLALFVGVSTLAPWTALSEPAPDPAWAELSGDETARAAAPAEADTETAAQTTSGTGAAPSADATAPKKRKGNSFGRALSAPFRALARLFGSGNKNRTAQKQQQRPTTKTTETAKATDAAKPTQAAARTQPPVINPAPAAVLPRPAVSTTAETVPTPTTDKGTLVVRPAEVAATVQPSKTFVPVIEGIGRDPLSQGRALLEHGYLKEAVSELSVAATTVAPGANLIEANNLLGLAYDRLGRHREAAECYRRALTVAPNDAVILANLGYSLYLSNDFEDALRRLQQAAKLSPGLSVVHNNIGIVQARLGRHDEAFRSFARATNQYDAHLKLASIHEIEKRERQAVKHYEAALRLQPNTSAVLERLVALYERTGDRTKAETARRALGQPSNPQKTTTGGGG